MKKVFVLNADSYDENREYEGTSIEGIYATWDLANNIMSNLSNLQLPTLEKYMITWSNAMKGMTDEEKKKKYSDYVTFLTNVADDYYITEYELRGDNS